MKAETSPIIYVQSPTQALRPFIKRFMVVESLSERVHTVLPDTGPVAVFRFSGDGVQDVPPAAISGLRDVARAVTYSKGSAVILAVFTEMGAVAFLRDPLAEFFNSTVALDGLLGSAAELSVLGDQLAHARDHAHRVQYLEGYLISRILNVTPDPVVSKAIARIESGWADIRIEDLAVSVGLSQSALERRFRRVIGSSPKTFASIVRLRNVLRLRSEEEDLTSLAYAAGYFDQSHFIKDFKQMTGLAPQTFFELSHFW